MLGQGASFGEVCAQAQDVVALAGQLQNWLAQEMLTAFELQCAASRSSFMSRRASLAEGLLREERVCFCAFDADERPLIASSAFIWLTLWMRGEG